LVVDSTQAADAASLPKLVQHPDIGHRLAIGQVGEATPGPLLGQQPHQMVESMDRGEHAQQMHPIQLGGTQLPAPAATTTERE
jgi:hypothetical protein